MVSMASNATEAAPIGKIGENVRKIDYSHSKSFLFKFRFRSITNACYITKWNEISLCKWYYIGYIGFGRGVRPVNLLIWWHSNYNYELCS